MTPLEKYGRRLTSGEYDQSIVELYSNPPDLPPEELDRVLRRREFDLTIDHRLGCEFPQQRREALWRVQESIERKRLSMLMKHTLRRLCGRPFPEYAKGLAGYVVAEYAQVLTDEELELFFGKESARDPALPGV